MDMMNEDSDVQCPNKFFISQASSSSESSFNSAHLYAIVGDSSCDEGYSKVQ